jgi:hypothetical protein
MRKKLAAEPFEEKIRKVGQLIALVRSFPKAPESWLAKQSQAGKESSKPNNDFL